MKGLTIRYIDPNAQLGYLLYKLIEIIRLENGRAFHLVKRWTLKCEAVVELDGHCVHLKATEENGYRLIVTDRPALATVNFATSSETLRMIMSGLITIDRAIADNDFIIKGTFEETMNIYTIALCLLADGASSNYLRKLWLEFLESWEQSERVLPRFSFGDQHAKFDRYIQVIPAHVLTIGC